MPGQVYLDERRWDGRVVFALVVSFEYFFGGGGARIGGAVVTLIILVVFSMGSCGAGWSCFVLLLPLSGVNVRCPLVLRMLVVNGSYEQA